MLLIALLAAGCGSRWSYSYIEAERQAAARERPLLITYRDHLEFSSGDLEDAVKSPAIEPMLKNYVLCSLVSAYAPNRKYVSQFGVASPPAVIVVHPDGTFHATTDQLTTEGIAGFLAGAKPPGRQPDRDISVPRSTDFLLRAEGVYERAVEKAKRLNRHLLIVYKWWLDDESTKLIARMSRPEVAVRCANAVHCVLDWDYIPNRKHVARYGVTRYPAIIIARPDGSADVLEGPASVERIVGFLSRALPGSTNPTPTVQLSTAKPGWRWSTDFERSRARARANSTGLFVFVHDAADEASARMMQLLQTDEAADLFARTINCSLTVDDSTRDLLAVYQTSGAPACIAIRPNGEFTKQEGLVTIAELRGLARFLE